MLCRLIRPVVSSGGAPAFDPATYSDLEVWVRGSYAGSPWLGVDSASPNASGGRDITEVTDAPSAGSTLDGFAPASFNGTSDELGNGSALGVTISTLQPQAGHRGWAMLNVAGIGTSAALSAGFNNDGVVCESQGYWGIALSTSGGNHIQYWFFDGTGKGTEHAISTGVWILIIWDYDGSTMRSNVNEGTDATQSAGTYDVATGALRIGTNYNMAAFSQMDVMEIGLRSSTGDFATFKSEVLSYIRDRYPSAGI